MGNKQSIKRVQSDGELVRDDSDVISVQSTISLSSTGTTGTTGNGGTTMGKTLEMTRRYQHLDESGRHRTVAMGMRAAVVERVMKCIGATLGLVMKCIGATLGVLCCLSQEDRALLAEGSPPLPRQREQYHVEIAGAGTVAEGSEAPPLPRQREQYDVEIAGAGAVADGSDALPPPHGREQDNTDNAGAGTVAEGSDPPPPPHGREQDNVVENAGTSTATAHRSVPNEAVIATPPAMAPASASRGTLPVLLEGQNEDGEEKHEEGYDSSGLLRLGFLNASNRSASTQANSGQLDAFLQDGTTGALTQGRGSLFISSTSGEGSSETSMSGHNFDNGALPKTE